MDNLSFLTTGYSMLEIQKALDKAKSIALNWETNNAVTHDINKTKAVFFSKIKNQIPIKQLSETKLRFGGQIVCFNKETT